MALNLIQLTSKPRVIAYSFLICWISYCFFYHKLLSNGFNKHAGLLILLGQASLDLVCFYLTYNFYKKAEVRLKKIYLYFAISFLSAFFADGIYNFGMNVLNIEYFLKFNSIFEVPFLLFLLFQSLAWLNIVLLANKNISKDMFLIIPYLVVSTLIFLLFIFGVPWNIKFSSLLGVYQLIDTFLEVMSFALVTTCLARSECQEIKISSIGYLIIISSDLLIRYSVVSGKIPFLSPFETTWVLGLSLMMISFFFKEGQLKLLALDSLQSVVSVWILNFFLMLIVLFISISSILSADLISYKEHLNKNLLLIIILFSVFANIVSKYLSEKISSPLEKIEIIINSFLNGEELNIENRDSNHSINELRVLEEFIYDSLKLHRKKLYLEMEFSKAATQVAHDIRSPLVTLNNFLSDGNIDLKEKDMIGRSLCRINDIADNLIAQYKDIKMGSTKRNDQLKNECLFSLLDQLIAEKKIEFRSRPIAIKFNHDNCTENIKVLINRESFQRVISNIINNAIESIKSIGTVTITLSKKNDVACIDISDSGCGIPSEALKNIENIGTLGKKNGSGLGLPYVFHNIHKWNASYQINSKVGIGTNFVIHFPLATEDTLTFSEVYIGEDCHILALTTETFLNSLKENLAKNFLNTHFPIISFKSLNQLLDYLDNTNICHKKVILFIDIDCDISTYYKIGNHAFKLCFIYIAVDNKEDLYKQKKINSKIKFFLKQNLHANLFHYIYSQPDLVLLDDQKSVTTIWQIESKKANKKINVFNATEDFYNFIDIVSRSTDIYLDVSLGNESGIDIAKDLIEKGYTDIYMSTGFCPEDFENLKGIKGITNKEPPFLLKNNKSAK